MCSTISCGNTGYPSRDAGTYSGASIDIGIVGRQPGLIHSRFPIAEYVDDNKSSIVRLSTPPKLTFARDDSSISIPSEKIERRVGGSPVEVGGPIANFLAAKGYYRRTSCCNVSCCDVLEQVSGSKARPGGRSTGGSDRSRSGLVLDDIWCISV